MEEDYNMVRGIDKLAELLIERGIEFCVNDEVSLVFKDDVGNLHECWMAGSDENRVNALIVVTPEQLLSVHDLNGIIAENAKLRDAMYTNAGKHALQHMDEDELRIWATQQSEHIEELMGLVRDMWRFTGTACKKYPRLFDPAAQGGQMVQPNMIDVFEQRMRELGIEAK